MRKRLNIIYIKEQIEKTSYICLNETYNNSSAKIVLECPLKHVFTTTWNSFQQGRRCPVCHVETLGEKIRIQHVHIDDKEYKLCTYCDSYKLLNAFFLDENTWDKLSRLCKECKSKYTKEWVNNNKESRALIIKKSNLKITHNLLLDGFNKLFEAQQGKCKICGTTESGRKGSKELHVDHCHKTGKIRGLLCKNCNNALGYAKDNIKILEDMIKYLKE